MRLFVPIFTALQKNEVSFVVVGGVAVVLHGYARLTADLDLVIGLDEKNVTNAVKAMKALGYVPRVPVNPMDFANEKIRKQWIEEKGLRVFSFVKPMNPLVGVDFFAEYPIDFDLLLKRSEIQKLGPASVRICGIDDLIRMKKMAGRAKDLEDIRFLEVLKNEKKEDR